MGEMFSFRVVAITVMALMGAIGFGFLLPEPVRTVTVGTTGTATDIGLHIAIQKGYFREEGLKIELSAQTGPGRMLDRLRNGALDVGGAIASPALYNAAADGAFKIVADKGSLRPMQNHFSLLVRADHIKSGRYKSLSDLKGMRIAVPGIANNNASARLNAILNAGGLKWDDVTTFDSGFAQHLLNFQRGEIDVSLTTEPIAGYLVEKGIAVRINQADLIYRAQQAGALLYSGKFIKERKADGEKFMRAYLRGVRDYQDSLEDGRLEGARADFVIAALARTTPAQNGSIFRNLAMPGIDTNGVVNTASLSSDLEFFKEKKWVTDQGLTAAQVVDGHFATAAIENIGQHGVGSVITQVRKQLRLLLSS